VIKGLIAVVVVIVAAAWYLAPPAARPLAPLASGASTPAVRGAIHIHTRRSDGTGTVDEVAAAAAAAGLDFVILTDHGDGVREADKPQYRRGVLTIDALEISTDGGHIVALDLPRSSYPLGGEPRDVLDDIARTGGFAIAAHPGSAKPELRWTNWDLPVGGIEWLNTDSEWRDESQWLLMRALFTYPVRRVESLATLLDRPAEVLRRWDTLTVDRRVVALAAADAHARVGLRAVGEPYDNGGASIHIPTYEDSFRAFSISLPQAVFTGDPPSDAKAVIAAIRAGHVYSTIDAVGGPAAMSFTATSADRKAVGGDDLPATSPITLRAEVQAPPDAQIVLLKNGAPAAMATGAILEHTAAPERAVYRIEVQLPGAPGQPPVPWIVSNPIYVGRDAGGEAGRLKSAPTLAAPTQVAAQYDNGPANGWTIEKSQASLAALDVVPAVPGTQIAFRYALGGTRSASPFAAVVMPAGAALPGYDRLMFMGRADRPMRLSVQLRVPNGPAGERWQRSVYIDTMPKQITISFADLLPRGATGQPRPDLSAVQSVLFVVDTVNADVGASGQVWIDDVRYGR
jgi:hypothetical protein